ncbi:MAG: hypothetical protein ACTSRK_00535 [Promethearchaeota archaeon]
MIGDANIISFSIDYDGKEIFEKVIQNAIKRLRELDPSVQGNKYLISTASADLLVKIEFYSKTLEEIISTYGQSFCIKSPFII